MRFWRILLVLATVTGSAVADIVYLKDGTSVSGAVKRVDGGWTVTDEDGKVTLVPEDQLVRLEKVGTLSPTESAASALRALRRAVDSVSDPADGIARFRKFIDQYKGTPAAAEAAGDLSM